MTNSRVFRLAVAAVFALAATASLAAAVTPPKRSAPSKSMLFRVRAPNGGATVYLLGSVHLLSPEAGKLPAVVDSVFARSSMIAFETSIDSVQMRAGELMARAQFANGKTLRTSLSPAGLAKADTLLRSYGASVDQLNGFKPWFVSMALAQLVMRKANFTPEYGVDMQLNARAKSAKKPVMGLEAVDFQLGLFDSIKPEDQETMLTQAESPDATLKQLTVIKDAWMQGNTTQLDSLLNSRMGESAGLFATLVTDRNKNWIPKIEQLLRGKDDVLVVVGAAHLVGKQGVVELLKAKGYSIEQM
ncbi:MAG TPA: TraB/GumN family protein [Gemmatimonadaceae bacterium]